MLKCLKIEQLFGRFDYTIELQKTPITILTGPNGFGKSTILKIIDAISATNILFFYKLSFKKITVTFTDDSIFSMEQKERNGKLPDLYINGERFPVDIIVSNRIHIPWLHRVSPGEWIDFRTREKITKDQIVFHIFDSDDSVQDVLEFSEISAKDAKKYSGIIQNTKSAAQKCGNVRLISEQRLIRKERDEDDDEQIVDVISQLPKKMRAKISELTANYSKAANSLDSSYPQRLLSTEDGLSSKHEFEMKMKAANDKFAKLSKYDLVDLDFIKSVNYKDEFAKALKVYFEDFEKKYTVFADFIEKLDLYTEIINSRLTFKTIKVTRDAGLVVVDSSDSILSLEQLSSGEKQEIVLFYELIFETDSQLLLLIDEPEISLHIMWQKMFMDDLDRVVKLGNLRVMIATHAPQIINNHWDIQVDLGELYGG